MATIEANGLSIGYEVVGVGPPLIALHGATGTGRDHLDPIMPLLANRFRVYLPAARGHGPTRWDTAAGFSTADLAADTLAFADALGLAKFHLLGYSMGAMTALHVAAERPDRLPTLVVISITPEREPRLSAAHALLDPDRIDLEEPDWARDLALAHDGVQGDGAWRSLLDAIVADIASQPLLSPQDLRGIEAPTLVVVGDRDPFAPVTHAVLLARQVAKGRLLVLPGDDHDPLGDDPAILRAGLIAFYRAFEPSMEDHR